MNSKSKLNALASPILLVIVAVSQGYFVHRHTLTKWKGGGFGMFSTPGDRTTVVTFIADDGEEIRVPLFKLIRFPVERSTLRRLRKLQQMPSESSLSSAVEILEQYDWIGVVETPKGQGEDVNRKIYPLPRRFAKPEHEAIGITDIGIEVWEYEFDRGDRNQLNRIMIAQSEVSNTVEDIQ